jgi:hypothetical protein
MRATFIFAHLLLASPNKPKTALAQHKAISRNSQFGENYNEFFLFDLFRIFVF